MGWRRYVSEWVMIYFLGGCICAGICIHVRYFSDPFNRGRASRYLSYLWSSRSSSSSPCSASPCIAVPAAGKSTKLPGWSRPNSSVPATLRADPAGQPGLDFSPILP